MSTQQQTCVKSALDSKHYSSVHSCEKCPYITKSLFFIRSHIKRQHSSNHPFFFDCAENTPEVYICKECNFKTYDTVIFNIHLKEHNLSFREFEENSQREASEFELKTEVYEEHEVKPFENQEIAWSLHHLHPNKTECTILFKTRAIYEYVDDKNTKWFKCDQCVYQTKNEVNLINHKTDRHAVLEKKGSYPNKSKCNIKNVKKVDKCSSRTELTNSSGQYANRSNIYSSIEDAEWLYCNKCPYKIKGNLIHDLRNHTIAKHTPLENIRWFHCNQCDYKTKLKKHLKPHTIDKHTTSKIIKWFHCDKCAFKTKRKGNLKNHIKIQHTPFENVEWFQCDKCDFKAKLKSYLKDHINVIHTPAEDADWLHCDNCSYKVIKRRSYFLRKHMIVKHTSSENIKWFHCDKCDFKAKVDSQLKQHLAKKHTTSEIKWFQCSECVYKTKNKNHFESHVNAKHTPLEDVQWFQCDQCAYKAKGNSQLKRHIFLRHRV